jgi:hypothetical protein
MVSQSPPARRAPSGSPEGGRAPRVSLKNLPKSYYLLVGGLIPPSPGLFELEFDDAGAAPVGAGGPAPLAVLLLP